MTFDGDSGVDLALYSYYFLAGADEGDSVLEYAVFNRTDPEDGVEFGRRMRGNWGEVTFKPGRG